MEGIDAVLDNLKPNATSSMELPPPPIPMRKSLSVGNISYQHLTANEFQQFCDPMYISMRNSIMKEVMHAMPMLVSDQLKEQLVPAMCTEFT